MSLSYTLLIIYSLRKRQHIPYYRKTNVKNNGWNGIIIIPGEQCVMFIIISFRFSILFCSVLLYSGKTQLNSCKLSCTCVNGRVQLITDHLENKKWEHWSKFRFCFVFFIIVFSSKKGKCLYFPVLILKWVVLQPTTKKLVLFLFYFIVTFLTVSTVHRKEPPEVALKFTLISMTIATKMIALVSTCCHKVYVLYRSSVLQVKEIWNPKTEIGLLVFNRLPTFKMETGKHCHFPFPF